MITLTQKDDLIDLIAKYVNEVKKFAERGHPLSQMDNVLNARTELVKYISYLNEGGE
jgi:hypothetical protein